VLNYASRCEDVWQSGGIAPRVLKLGTRWKRVLSFTSWPLYTRGNNPRYPPIR